MEHEQPDATRGAWRRRTARESRRLRQRTPRVLLFSVLGTVLVGCATTAPPRARAPFDSVPPFSAGGGAERTERAVRWWEAFDDALLTAHVERGLEGNYSLRAAWERLAAARAVVRRTDADRMVTLDATGGATVRDGDDVVRRTELSVGLVASYEVDLWDRIRATIEADELEAAATAEDYQVAALSLSAEIALALYRGAEATAQLELIDSQLETNRRVLTVIEQRFGIGESDSADVLRQRQLVEATEEQRLTEAVALEFLEHQLAVLEGEPPQRAERVVHANELPHLPALPEIGVPAALLQRRPDVRAAFLRLDAADATVAAAVADQYPRLDLSASLTSAAENPSGVFSSWIASLMGQIVAPLIDGDRRRAEVERTVAVRRQRLAEYGETVLAAFREVEDALADEQHQVARIASLERQIELARATYRELRSQYLNGAGDFIDVLVALRDQQTLERDVLEARLFRIEARIALHRAIGGGFVDLSAPEAADDATTDAKGHSN